MEAAEVLRRLGGRAQRADILEYCTRHALNRAMHAGGVERVGHGRYVLPALPPAAKLAARFGGSVSHLSAAEHWDFATLFPARQVHLVVRGNAHRRPDPRVMLHYAGRPGDGQVTDPLRTVLDCAALLPWNEALAVADSACRRGTVDREMLVHAAEARQGRGRARMLRVARSASALAANPFESCLRAIVLDAGLDGFRPQLKIADDELFMHVDLGDPGRRIGLEADSFEWHGKRKALNRDCHRYDELVSRGWLVLRFSWEQVMFHPEWVRQIVLRTCRLREVERPGGRRKAADPADRARSQRLLLPSGREFEAGARESGAG